SGPFRDGEVYRNAAWVERGKDDQGGEMRVRALLLTLAFAFGLAATAAAAPTPTPQDRTFVMTAGHAGAAEIAAAKLALTKTSDRATIAFAQQMIRDHTALAAKLK